MRPRARGWCREPVHVAPRAISAAMVGSAYRLGKDDAVSRAEYVVVAVGGVVSTVIGTLVALPVFAMGLVVPMTVVWPLMLAVCALAASVVAGLFVEFSRSDGPGVRLPAVILATEAAAGLLAFVAAIMLLLPYWAQPSWPAIYDIVASASALALVATVAAWRFRVVGARKWRNVAVALGVLLLAPPLAYGVLLASCAAFVYCGP